MDDYNSNVKELEKIAGLLMKKYADIEVGNSKYNANDLEQKYYEQREKVNSMTRYINANKIQQTASLKTGKEICNKVLAYSGATAVIAGFAVGTAVLGDKLNSIK